MPFFLYLLSYISLKNYTNLKYRLSLEWTLLELRVPREPGKSPKAMEQIFAGLHGIYAIPVRWIDALFKGKMPDWYSFEIVGNSGETHFYVRTLTKYRNIVESHIYAQYPDAEIAEVPDYINELPQFLPDDKHDLWGTEMILNKEDAYPIRTYPDFEEKMGGPDDVKRIDPLAALSELFSTLRPGERIWIQFIANPVGDGWIKKAQAVIDLLMGKETPPKKGDLLSEIFFGIDRAISGLASGPAVEKKEEKKDVKLSPGKQDTLKAIEKSLDKLGYETGIRFMVIGPKDDFKQANVAGVMGAFRQFSSQNLNGFKPNVKTITAGRGLFKESKALTKKRALYQSYKERRMMPVRFTLNTEELATIFHFPDTGVKSPLLPRVETKKGEPPVGLPIS